MTLRLAVCFGALTVSCCAVAVIDTGRTPIEALRALGTKGNRSLLQCTGNVDTALLFWTLPSLGPKLDLVGSLSQRDEQNLLAAGCEWLWATEPGLISLELYSGRRLVRSYGDRVTYHQSDSSPPPTDRNGTQWICDNGLLVEHVEVTLENQIAIVIESDLSTITINQCDKSQGTNLLNGTNKCHHTTECIFKEQTPRRFVSGNYWCACKTGYYSTDGRFDGADVEASLSEIDEKYSCNPCSIGCDDCQGPDSCMARFSWIKRSIFLIITLVCIVLTVILIWFVHKNRRIKVFRIASPTFLVITLIGCIIMYSEMGMMFPQCSQQLCVATKWTRHFGFCITYSALLMKTWRVSLTYRVKSAHKLKLTDNQLLQWMTPILVIILVYMGSWTLSDPPLAVLVKSEEGTKFWQCSSDWWDHCLAAGEVLFLAWGVRVCYVVRNAESFYNEAKLISFAIYNIFIVNIIMMIIHFLLFPNIGPDLKYTLGFIRTQLSTSVTIGLVFGSKVVRVLSGQGDHWDSKGLPAKGLMSYEMSCADARDEPVDLQTENDQLKEEVFKMATQIGLMRNSLMHVNNRHLRKNGCSACNPTASNQQSPTGKTAGGFFKSLGSNNCLAPL
ncbi:probable G-protein coupled receptor CG31760 isoform X2 [Adelges cooleyi]|uniref:probable G-protein coupled receptor CG31760 isoform X2 n=1 Tax=Adelges cooleyi TaxID=133065 RepID=UPI00217FCD65|nr:probable G-protein coupled receptor CG31760 isoform X2 [Adelges cooleyi]